MNENIINFEILGFTHSLCAIKHSYKLGVHPSNYFNLEDKDFNLALKLGSVPIGAGHDSFLKGIRVEFDLRCSQYFDHELQRYNYIDIVSCQSIMHKLDKIKDNSTLKTFEEFRDLYFDKNVNSKIVLDCMNSLSKLDKEYTADDIREILPESFMLWKTISTNYLQLKTIYYQRKNHRLKEWRDFCEYLENIPFLKNIINNSNNDKKEFTSDEILQLRTLSNYYELEI